MSDESTVIARVAQGELRGRKRTSAWGFPYLSFQGVPYAAPPVGPLRFKPPQPPAAWSGVRDATKQGNIAPQLNMLTQQLEGDEDCLFLNVYTPKLPPVGSGGLLPVMVMIHGGGLAVLSGNEEFFGPDFLMPHSVLLVTFNYRLGVLGFLSTGDSVVPGNMGFKDQVMALRWVRDNIASFGGDPENVTIFGSSAGGWSCHALILSPMGKGLFRRAIAQSGVAVGDGMCSDRVRERSFLLAAHLGLKTEDSKELVDFLRKQPALELLANALHGRTDDDKARGLMLPFVGTVEPADAEGGAFLPLHPVDILGSGDFPPVPLIAGVCAFEGSVFAPGFLTDNTMISNATKNHHLLIPSNLRCPEDDKDALAEKIRRFYFGDRDVGPETLMEFLTLIGDVTFNYPAVRVASSHTPKSSAPVYFYIFNVIGEGLGAPGMVSEIFKFMKETNAAGHGSEMGYVCRATALGSTFEQDSADGKVAAKMSHLWTNFAKTGQPTAGSDPELEVSWPAFTADDQAYLQMNSSGFTVAHRPFAERVAFWEDLYSRYDC